MGAKTNVESINSLDDLDALSNPTPQNVLALLQLFRAKNLLRLFMSERQLRLLAAGNILILFTLGAYFYFKGWPIATVGACAFSIFNCWVVLRK